MAEILRLRGPLSDDPASRTLHALLLSILAWYAAYMLFWFPAHETRKLGTIGITFAIALTAVVALYMLRRGSLRISAITYVWGMWLSFSVLIFFFGGIQSPALIFYMALPISAAWLFGYRGTMWTAAGCLSSGFALAVLEKLGIGPYVYFGNGRFGFGMVPNLILATLMAVVPVARVMKTLQDSLAHRKRIEEELLQHQEHLQELVAQRTSELVDARDQAQASNRAKTLFLANMSHELRTPLNSILGFSDLIRRDEGISGKQAEALAIINRSGAHLLALIDEVLDMVRIEAGHRTLEVARVDLRKVVEDAICMMRIPSEEKNLKLAIEWSDAPVRMVRGDEPKLRQILVNLVGNAIKYTAAGSIVLRVNSALEGDGRVRLRIEVQDTGIGIAPEEQARIFEPFVQLSQPAARSGSGLGLAICRQFVQMMDGEIRVTSAPGIGSTFLVDLFVEAAEESQADAEWLEIDSSVILHPDQPRYRIMVVEDEPGNSLLLQRVLQRAGFQVRTARDGETGLRLFSQWQPHFIWLDIRLPGISGLEVASHIRELPGGRVVKIAALTASVLDEERNSVLAAGFDDFVRKPFRTKAIFSSIERLLGVRYARTAAPEAPVSDIPPQVLSQVAALPEDLKSRLLTSVVLLNKQSIIEVTRLVSAINPPLGAELFRRADALEFTSILGALESDRAA